MTRFHTSIARPTLLGVLVILGLSAPQTSAGERWFHRSRRSTVQPVPTAYRPDPVYAGRLGTFYPTPVIAVQSNNPVGGGFAPLDIFGDQTMALYGPFSALRTTTAPVLTYSRGYDGVVRPVEGITNTYPILPQVAPVAYPTRANYYYGPRIIENPAKDSAINWIDQN
jgi:hypothetical protein